MRTIHLAALGSVTLAALALAQRDGGARPAAPPPDQAPPTEPGDPGSAKPPASGTTPPSTEDQPVLYFKTADYNEDGRISFDEAKASMNLDRSTFAVFDTDRDGLISAAEFAQRYKAVTSRGGAFTPPVGRIDKRRIPKRTDDELIDAFDVDHKGGLDAKDIERALREYGAQGVDAALVLATVDHDQSQRVEKAEAQALLDILVPPSAATAKKRFTSIDELFDRTEPRKHEQDSTPLPTRILGPVSTFRRLDFDKSGGISVADLEALQRPLNIPVRAGAVIATLDLDGDGDLSPEEFAAALR